MSPGMWGIRWLVQYLKSRRRKKSNERKVPLCGSTVKAEKYVVGIANEELIPTLQRIPSIALRVQ
jgi:hypothetical protein